MLDKPEHLKQLAHARASEEMRQHRNTEFADTGAERDARARIDRAYEDCVALIDACDIPNDVPKPTREGWIARRDVMLHAVEVNLIQPIAPHMRAALMQGLRETNTARGEDLKDAADMSVADATERVKDIVEAAEAATKFLTKLAKDPLGYYDAADTFLKGHVTDALRALKIKATPGMPWGKLNDFVETLKDYDITARMFRFAGKVFEGASKFLGWLQIGLQVVMTVFKSVADSANFGHTVAKGTFGVAVGVGLMITDAGIATAVEGAVASLLSAAGISAEVPPVALTLLASGVVIAAVWAVTELFSAVVDWLFSPTDIPAIMMTETFVSTAGETSASVYTPTWTPV